MNNAQVAHLWASGRKESGKGSNFFFEGGTIYSYGYHFPISKRLSETIYLITEKGYSGTTSKHKCLVRRAIPSFAKCFSVSGDPRDSFSSIRDEKLMEARIKFNNIKAKTKVKTYKNARSFRLFLSDAVQMFGEFKSLDDNFSFKENMGEIHGMLESSIELENSLKEIFDASEIKKDETRRKREETRRKMEEMEAAEAAPLWREGKPCNTWKLRSLPPMLRIHGGKVQTSHGAEVELEEARKAFAFISRKIESGQTWQRNGETCAVGPFSLHAIAEDVVIVGCHKFPVAEVVAFGSLL